MYYGPVYLQVQASSATISWRKKDERTKVGFGYEQYTPSKLRYAAEGNVLNVNKITNSRITIVYLNLMTQ